MELSYFLAQLMGLSLAIFSAIGIIRPRIIGDAIKKFDTNPLTTLFFGFAGIVIGLSVILSHNIWEFSWLGVITLFGWAALAKGVLYLIAPNVLLGFGKTVYKNAFNIRSVLVVGLIVGLYLAWQGFGY